MTEPARQPWLAVYVVGLVVTATALSTGVCAAQSGHVKVGYPPTMTPPVLALYNEGATAFRAGDFPKAQKKYQAALEQARLLGDERGIGASLAGLGAVYQALQEYPKALEFFSATVPYFKRTKNLAAEGWALAAIGEVHAQMGNDANAIEFFDRALAIGERVLAKASEQEKLGILALRARVLGQKGMAHEALEQFIEAVESYRQAAADFHMVGNRENAGMVLWEAGQIARLKMKAPRQAIGLLAEAWPLLQETGRVVDAISARLALAWAYFEAGDYQEAEAVASEVVKVAKRERLPALTMEGYLVSGVAFDVLGELEQVLTQYQAALHWLREGDVKGVSRLESRILTFKGRVHRLLSQYEEAIEHFHAAAAKYREAEDAKSEADVLTDLAEVFFWLADQKTAIHYYKQALSLYKETDNLPKQVEILAALGESSLLKGDARGYEYLRQGERLLFLGESIEEKKLPVKEYVRLWGAWLKKLPSLSPEYRMAAGNLYQKLGRVTLKGGRLGAAIEYLKLAAKSHASLPLNRDTIFEKAKDWYYLAEAYRQQGELDQALSYFQAVTEIGGVLRTPEIHFVYAGQARTYADMGDAEKAVRYYKKGLVMLESVQGQQGTEEIKIGVLAGALYAYRGLVTLLLDLHAKTGETRYLHEAFQYNERLRARAFLDMLGKSRVTRLGGELGPLAAKEAEIRHQIARIHRQLRAPKLDKAEETRLLDRLEGLRNRWRAQQQQAAQQSQRYAQVVLPRPVTVEEVQSILHPDAVLLEYSVASQGSTLWAITKHQVKAYSLPGSQKLPVLYQYLKTVREPLMGSDEVSGHLALGRELYRALLRPAERQIRGKKHLIIVPDGPLYYLPFEALIMPESRDNSNKSETLADARYLVKEFRVTYAPSASVWLTQRKKRDTQVATARFPLVAFGDPVYREADSVVGSNVQTRRIAHEVLRGDPLSRLEFSAQEVRRIARIWDIPLDSAHINLRDRATVERVRELDLSQYRIVHFATHGVLGDEIRLTTQPALVLSQIGDKDEHGGLLQFADILDLKLNADLVVLSACNTRLGRLREGEGIVGLTRAFLYAGASSVVVSLWKVEDQSTSILMERFYQRIKQGEGKAEALRQAKLDVLRSTIELKALGMPQALASPFYWAPFILVGEAI